jgi:hypothetical protein
MRVEQRGIFLGQIAKSAGRGEYGLAPFQRQYEWDRDDVESLFKSILKGWPLGTFMSWTPNPADPVQVPHKGRFGPLAQESKPTTLILDGQNRLTSLIWATHIDSAPTPQEAAALGHPYSEQEIDVWFSGLALTVDAESKSVHFVPDDEVWSPSRVPFGRLMDAEIIMSEPGAKRRFYSDLTTNGVAEEHIGWLLDTMPQTIREARSVCTDMLYASFDEAKECFLTICKAGKPISAAEFDRAFEWQPETAPTTAPGL